MNYLDGKVKVSTGDITEQETDAIVNAANSSLLGGGGVDGAIHRKGGPEILEACRKIRENIYPEGLPAGQAVSTTAGRLRARWVIHTVGPVWHGGSGGEDDILKNAYLSCLKEAVRLGCASVSFPAVSTGVYGFPPERAAALVSSVIKEFINENNPRITIYLVFYSKTDYDIFIKNQKFGGE
ncbi:MAG: O-acetyl-ADP-ribose deacetylase [Brevinematales bacterium]|jgi:O-acetyl-ADP-ribose deacetylase (regulator of RNase III)